MNVGPDRSVAHRAAVITACAAASMSVLTGTIEGGVAEFRAQLREPHPRGISTALTGDVLGRKKCWNVTW